ncbi:MAG: hypothetical protein K2Q06_03865, partial [Parvularculaceae bacterium]|nr:hypothetical protein [Parvularculaceae bacterium]
FQAAFNQMAREAEIEDMRREIEALKRDNAFTEARAAIEESVRPVETALAQESAKIDEAYHKLGAPDDKPAPPADAGDALPAKAG